MSKELSGAEAVYGFAAWLTGRKEKTVLSSSDDAAKIADLVDIFCKGNKLDFPSIGWSKDLNLDLESSVEKLARE